MELSKELLESPPVLDTENQIIVNGLIEHKDALLPDIATEVVGELVN